MTDTRDQLDEMAADELERAVGLPWRELARVVPWGDVYEGFAASGGPVLVERAYLWSGPPGGDILCEVNVHLDAARYELGAKRSAIIARQP